jgi:diacylglycerol O-acyltransferase
VKQLSSLDAALLDFDDGRNTGNIGALALIDPATAPDGAFTAERVRQIIQQRLHLLPVFRWRLAEVPLGLDHPYWVESEDVDLEFHVRELALPAPGTDRELASLVAQLHAYPLDRNRPLWELYVITGLASGEVAAMTKMHHASIDGVSGAEVMSAVLDSSPRGRQVARPSPGPAERVPAQLELLGRGLVGLSKRPGRALWALPRVVPHMDQIPALRTIPGARYAALAGARIGTLRGDGGVLERPRLDAPHTRYNERISSHRRVAITRLDLAQVKALKNHFGVTVNDIVLALGAGALRRRLLAHGELPNEPLLAAVPVSVRAAGDEAAHGVRVSTMIVALPTNEPDAATRIRSINAVMRSAKDRHRAMPATVLQDTFELLPTTLLARAARVAASLGLPNPLKPPANVTISNVPGARTPLYCIGGRVTALYPISMVNDGMALNLTVMSYCDELCVGVVGDRELVPDTWELVEDIRAEFADLLELLGQTEPVSAR